MVPTSSIIPQNGKSSRKVILQPGHSPLDWAILTKDPESRLRGRDVPDHLIRITPSQLKYHNGRKGRDAWSVYQGKVYNITPYLPFHPGGEGELMRGAAKDAGQLFMEVHPWVNWDNMLFECMVGILVGEDEAKDDKSGGLDEMD
jgi:cytochrome b involved in lipid metabolism